MPDKPLADSSVSERLHQIRKEEGRVDTDWRTATGTDLDAIAAQLDLSRIGYESDVALRSRIQEAVMKRSRGSF